MIRDITIGQYYPVDSIIHKIDPRVKIIGTFAFIIILFMIEKFWGYIFITFFLSYIINLAKVPIKYILKGLKPIFILLIITVLLNMIFTPGTKILFQLWKIKITLEGVKFAAFMGTRLVFLIIGSSLLTLTTSPIRLTDGIESLLKPLEKIRVPAHEIAMMMTIALRFIPILLEETDKIMKAQMARGADFESGGVLKKAKSLIPLLVPLFISAFRRADDLAMAMEARCYRGGEGRTKLHPLKYTNYDYISYCILITMVICIILINIML